MPTPRLSEADLRRPRIAQTLAGGGDDLAADHNPLDNTDNYMHGLILMTPSEKGLLAVGAFISYATAKGWTLCEPLLHDLPYDFLALIDGTWKRVQVKTTYTSSKGYREVNFRRGRTHKRTAYAPSDFDVLFVFDVESGNRWVLPMAAVSNQKSCIMVSSPRWHSHLV